MKLTLDKMSRLVVPKPLRDRFALKPGDELEVIVETDGIHLRPVVPQPAFAEVSGILICTSEVPTSVWDTGDFMESLRDQRSRQLGGM